MRYAIQIASQRLLANASGSVPLRGAPVIINARLARWRCRNQRCDRRIFTERLPGLAAPFARQTARMAGLVRLLGHSAAGRPSERLMRRLGMSVSDTTILRSLKERAGVRSDNGAVHVAGIDDGAWREGANYGTIIVDLERRQVVDLLADRSAATTASWFKDHPEVEMVSRGRAGLYADAPRQGAPQARQIAEIAFICCRTSARPLSDSGAALRRRSGILRSTPEIIGQRHRFQHDRIVVLMP